MKNSSLLPSLPHFLFGFRRINIKNFFLVLFSYLSFIFIPFEIIDHFSSCLVQTKKILLFSMFLIRKLLIKIRISLSPFFTKCGKQPFHS